MIGHPNNPHPPVVSPPKFPLFWWKNCPSEKNIFQPLQRFKPSCFAVLHEIVHLLCPKGFLDEKCSGERGDYYQSWHLHSTITEGEFPIGRIKAKIRGNVAAERGLQTTQIYSKPIIKRYSVCLFDFRLRCAKNLISSFKKTCSRNMPQAVFNFFLGMFKNNKRVERSVWRKH